MCNACALFSRLLIAPVPRQNLLVTVAGNWERSMICMPRFGAVASVVTNAYLPHVFISRQLELLPETRKRCTGATGFVTSTIRTPSDVPTNAYSLLSEST